MILICKDDPFPISVLPSSNVTLFLYLKITFHLLGQHFLPLQRFKYFLTAGGLIDRIHNSNK